MELKSVLLACFDPAPLTPSNFILSFYYFLKILGIRFLNLSLDFKTFIYSIIIHLLLMTYLCICLFTKLLTQSLFYLFTHILPLIFLLFSFLFRYFFFRNKMLLAARADVEARDKVRTIQHSIVQYNKIQNITV